jgi:hypothetical protein
MDDHHVVRSVGTSLSHWGKTRWPRPPERDRGGNDAPDLIRDTVAKAKVIAAQFPRLSSRVNAGAAEYGAAPEDSFHIGLEAILYGLEVQLTPSVRSPQCHTS